MKQKISYNSILSGLSFAIFVIFIAIFVLFWVFIDKPFDNVFLWILVGLFAVWLCLLFGYTPSSVSADDEYIGVSRPFSRERYRISDIKSVEPVNDDNYASAENRGVRFHGKYKNPVIITLKNGKRYIIGSDDPKVLIEYINSRIS